MDVEKGRENLGKAENLQKSARKKKVKFDRFLILSIFNLNPFQVILGILAVVVVLILLLGILIT